MLKTVVLILLGLVVVGGVIVTKWVLFSLFGEMFGAVVGRGWRIRWRR
jgi:hypothetical protein